MRLFLNVGCFSDCSKWLDLLDFVEVIATWGKKVEEEDVLQLGVYIFPPVFFRGSLGKKGG